MSSLSTQFLSETTTVQSSNFYNRYINKSIPGGDVLFVNMLLKDIKRDVLWIAQDSDELERLHQHLSFFVARDVIVFPEWDCMPYDRAQPAKDITGKRAYALSRLTECMGTPKLILTTGKALTQKIPPRSFFKGKKITCTVGQMCSRDDIIAFLSQHGYERVGTVRETAEYAIRGEIIDIFTPYSDLPIRFDFFGDELESMCYFDPLTQIRDKTKEDILEYTFYPAKELFIQAAQKDLFLEKYEALFGVAAKQDHMYVFIKDGIYFPGQEHYLPLFFEELGSLCDYITPDLVIHSAYLKDRFNVYQEEIASAYQQRKETSYAVDEEFYQLFPIHLMYYQNMEEVLPNNVNKVMFDFFSQESAHAEDMPFKKHLSLKNHKAQEDRFTEIRELIKKPKKKVLFTFSNLSAVEKLSEMLKFHHVGRTLIEIKKYSELEQYAKGTVLPYAMLELEDGFEGEEVALITQKDILGYSKKKVKERRFSKTESEFFLAESSSMGEGDLVVHMDYGVGRYAGLKTVTVDHISHDCLLLHYAGEDRLFVPVENADLISRFGTSSSDHPLDKLGGASWKIRKAKAFEKIKESTDQIINIAAQRELREGVAFHLQSGLYDEFASRFAFAETEDQEKAIRDVMEDLSSGRIMDRLICGDVGFGKTEVALRAAFLVAASGKQVIIIAPTTVLAVQHFHNFNKRFAGFNIRIELLSRLITGKKAKEVKERLEYGDVDIIVGTHALLSPNIKFYDPGLLIIDEEQHFGVLQKESLKKLKSNIHVLTLTATPIPRTLQMSLSGIRDLSLITTPPVNRLSIATFVLAYDSFVIKEALVREYQRGGQSFFVCPKISDLVSMQEKIMKLVPELRIAVAHGRLSPKDLDEIMSQFVDKKYDILLATNIIESGIDIPNANTMIIHKSHLFGLSQLYQLRGRVGRSQNKGYCYLTYPREYQLNKIAMKRLDVMQTLDSLGAGFTIASHDMDIRGVGNLVGEEQSGHVKEVGVELYQKMLNEALAIARRKKIGEDKEIDHIIEGMYDIDWSPRIHIPKTVLIPEDYVSDIDVRLSLYKRLTIMTSQEELNSYKDELMDRFGSIPPQTQNLFDVISLKMLCKKCFVEKLDIGEKGALLSFRNNIFPQADDLIRLVYQRSDVLKIRPDHKLFMSFAGNDVAQHIKMTQELLEKLIEIL